jgi:hypothetical protein
MNWWKLCVCVLLPALCSAFLPGCERPPNPVYKVSFVTPDRRIIDVFTESDSTKKAWQINPFATPSPTVKILDKMVAVEPQQIVVNG